MPLGVVRDLRLAEAETLQHGHHRAGVDRPPVGEVAIGRRGETHDVGLGWVDVVLQRFGDDHHVGRALRRLRERSPRLAQVQEDRADQGDVEGPEVGGHVVDVPLHELGGRAEGAVQMPPGVVVGIDRSLHDQLAFLGLVLAVKRQGVDRNVEAGLEGDDLGTLSLHPEGQVTGRGPQLEDPLARDIDPAEIFGLVTPEVPHPGQHRAIGHFGGVVPGEVAEIGSGASSPGCLLMGVVELAQIFLGWVIGEEWTASLRGRFRCFATCLLAFAPPEHGPSL